MRNKHIQRIDFDNQHSVALHVGGLGLGKVDVVQVYSVVKLGGVEGHTVRGGFQMEEGFGETDNNCRGDGVAALARSEEICEVGGVCLEGDLEFELPRSLIFDPVLYFRTKTSKKSDNVSQKLHKKNRIIRIF